MSPRPTFKDRFLSKDREEAAPAPESQKDIKLVKRPRAKKKSTKKTKIAVPQVLSTEPLRFTLYMDPNAEVRLDAEKRRRRTNGQTRRATSFNALVNEAILKYYG